MTFEKLKLLLWLFKTDFFISSFIQLKVMSVIRIEADIACLAENC